MLSEKEAAAATGENGSARRSWDTKFGLVNNLGPGVSSTKCFMYVLLIFFEFLEVIGKCGENARKQYKQKKGLSSEIASNSE